MLTGVYSILVEPRGVGGVCRGNDGQGVRAVGGGVARQRRLEAEVGSDEAPRVGDGACGSC